MESIEWLARLHIQGGGIFSLRREPQHDRARNVFRVAAGQKDQQNRLPP